MRSPSANASAIAAASRRHDVASPASEAGRLTPMSEYSSPPMPMPTSATARINPKVNTEPPSSGPSIRYQTSSIRKKAKPTTPEATSRNETGACGSIAPRRHSDHVVVDAVGGTIDLTGKDDDQDVEARGEPQRAARAEYLEQVKRRGNAPDHGAECVQAVEDSHVLAARVAPSRHSARGGRQRAPHHDRRHREHDRAEHEAEHRAADRSQLQRAAEREVDELNDGQDERRERRGDGDDGFELRVIEDRTRVAVGPGPEDEPPDAEPADEDGQHRGRRGGRGAEDQPELPHPRGLIDESGTARTEQQQRHLPRLSSWRFAGVGCVESSHSVGPIGAAASRL